MNRKGTSPSASGSVITGLMTNRTVLGSLLKGCMIGPPNKYTHICTHTLHGKKNWSAQLGSLLVRLAHYPKMHYCEQGCAPLATLQDLVHLSAQVVHTLR